MTGDEPGTPVEIVAVGRELLAGHTTDTNSVWLAGELPALGGRLTRIVVVDDEPEAIAREIGRAVADGARLVITTGGLGPTFDDRTLAGVAAALDRPLAEHAGALEMVGRRYAELAATGAVADATLTPARRKMARLPEGAEAVPNTAGTAPGVFVAGPPVTVLAVPGVPAEMRAVTEAARERLVAVLGAPVFQAVRERRSGSGDESRLTAIAEAVMARHPGVHVKSLPTAFAPDCDLVFRLVATGATPEQAERRIADAQATLDARLAAMQEGR